MTDRPEKYVRTEVTFEDGRKGAIEATVEIRDMKTYEPGARNSRRQPNERSSIRERTFTELTLEHLLRVKSCLRVDNVSLVVRRRESDLQHLVSTS
jgi:hypothetical protein